MFVDKVWSHSMGPIEMCSLITAGFYSSAGCSAGLCCAFKTTEAIKAVYIRGIDNTAAANAQRQQALEAQELIPRFWAQNQETGMKTHPPAQLIRSTPNKHPELGLCGPGQAGGLASSFSPIISS